MISVHLKYFISLYRKSKLCFAKLVGQKPVQCLHTPRPQTTTTATTTNKQTKNKTNKQTTTTNNVSSDLI